MTRTQTDAAEMYEREVNEALIWTARSVMLRHPGISLLESLQWVVRLAEEERDSA